MTQTPTAPDAKPSIEEQFEKQVDSFCRTWADGFDPDTMFEPTMQLVRDAYKAGTVAQAEAAEKLAEALNWACNMIEHLNPKSANLSTYREALAAYQEARR